MELQRTSAILEPDLFLREVELTAQRLNAHLSESRVRPISQLTTTKLCKKSREEIERAWSNLSDLNSLLDQCEIERISPFNSIALSRVALKSLRLRSPDGFLDTTHPEDIIEIYDLAGIQLFRNMRFFEVTSYSLADLLLNDWQDLFLRSNKVLELMHERCATLLGGAAEILPMNIPRHPLKEIMAEPVQVVMVEFGNLGILRNQVGTPFGFIVNCKAQSLQDSVVPESLDFI